MAALSQRAQQGMERKVRAAVETTAREAIVNTPVDVGRARSSWMVGVGAPPSGERQAFTPYEALHSKEATFQAGRFFEAANAQGAIAAARQALRSYRLGQPVYLVNSVTGDDGHYLQALNRVPMYSLQATLLAGLLFIEMSGQAGRSAAANVRVF